MKAKENSRWVKATIIFSLHFLITPYFAYFLHQVFDVFLGGKYYLGWSFDWNYLRALQLLIIDRVPGMIICWGISEIFFLMILIYILLRPHAEIHKIQEYHVTDYITIPVPAGNGQYGKSWFASKEDEQRLMKTLVINENDSNMVLKDNPGVVLSMEKDIRGVDHIRYLSVFSHSIILALTGAGKTRRVLLETICLQIMAGHCVLVSDVKGEIYYYTKEFAKKHGYDIEVIDLNNPMKSSHYNFLQPVIDAIEEGKAKHKKKIEDLMKIIKDEKQDLQKIAVIAKKIEVLKADYSWTDKAQDRTWDLVSILVGEPKGEPIWYNGETATLAASILAICLEAPYLCQNFYNLYMFIGYMAQPNPLTGKTPLTAYLQQLPDNHPAKIVFMQGQVAVYRTQSSFYTQALGTLRLFTNPTLAEMSSKNDIKLGDIGTKKTIVYLIIPDERKTYYSIASILIQQMYIAQVETARKSGGRLPIPTDYDLDEVGNFPTIPVMSNIVSVGRSRGIKVNLVLQDYQQLEAKYEKDFETIKSQCGVKIYLKSDSDKTLKSISEKLGTYTVESAGASTSANTNLNSQDVNISNSSNLTGRPLLKEEELAKFKAPDALIMITGENPIVTKLPDLSEYHFNKMLGLGNEEHNLRLIERIENERPERENTVLPLWGIWNKYKALLEKEAEMLLKK